MKRILAIAYLVASAAVVIGVIGFAVALFLLEALRGNPETIYTLKVMGCAVGAVLFAIGFMWALSEVEP